MLHTLALTLMRGMTQAQTLELLRHIPDARSIFEHPDDALAEVHPKMQRNIKAALAEYGSDALKRAEAELNFCERHHIRALSIHDADYPQRLAECPDAPAVVFFRGSASLNPRHVLAVVGTRRITPYGADLCRLFCSELAQILPETLVVSGLAYGVDIHAHRECLAHGLSTVGVLAHGLDQIYPAAHRETAKAMLQQGGLLTEYITQTQARSGNFVRRNRIVAGMADATVVVESAFKGGALITAQLANDYSRGVCAFPGRSTDQYSEGCHRLIRNRVADLVTSAYDVVEVLGWNAHTAQPKAPIQLEMFTELNEQQLLVAELLRRNDGLSASQLCIQTNLDLATINTLLFELEMMGVVRLLAGGIYRFIPR